MSKVLSIRCPGLIFVKNWNLHFNTLVMRLRSLTSGFYNLSYVIPIHTLRIMCLTIFQAIFEYGSLVWGGLNENALSLNKSTKQIVCICLRKGTLDCSSNDNFKTAIMGLVKNLNYWVNVYDKKRKYLAFNGFR